MEKSLWTIVLNCYRSINNYKQIF